MTCLGAVESDTARYVIMGMLVLSLVTQLSQFYGQPPWMEALMEWVSGACAIGLVLEAGGSLYVHGWAAYWARRRNRLNLLLAALGAIDVCVIPAVMGSRTAAGSTVGRNVVGIF